MSNQKRDLFHSQFANYSRTNLLNKLKQTAKNDHRFLNGLNRLPKPQPQGSFNRLDSFSGNSNQLNYNMVLGNMRGGVLRDNTKVREQLKRRGEQLKELNLGLPPPKREDIETPETVKTSFELFFSELSNVDFSLKEVTNNAKEAKQVLGNLKAYGLGLSINSLERYSQIVETHIDNYLGNMEKLFIGRDLFGKFITEKGSGEGRTENKIASTYIDYLERIDYYEVIFKIYLVLQSLINSYNMNPLDRKQKFDGDFKQIIQAKKNTLFNEDMKQINEKVKNGVDNLKELLPRSAYQEIERFVRQYKDDKDSDQRTANLTDRGDVKKKLQEIKESEEEYKRAKDRANKIRKLEKIIQEQIKLRDTLLEEYKKVLTEKERTEAEIIPSEEDENKIAGIDREIQRTENALKNHIRNRNMKGDYVVDTPKRREHDEYIASLEREREVIVQEIDEKLTANASKIEELNQRLNKLEDTLEDLRQSILTNDIKLKELESEEEGEDDTAGQAQPVADRTRGRKGRKKGDVQPEILDMFRDGEGEESEGDRPKDDRLIIGQGRYLSPEQFTQKFIVGAGSNWFLDIGDSINKTLGIF